MKTNEYQSLPIEIVASAHAKNSEYGPILRIYQGLLG